MSNYTRQTKNPNTGKWEDAEWLDDYYGSHQYGVRFPDGTVYPEDGNNLETRDNPVVSNKVANKEECKHQYGTCEGGYNICGQCGAKVGGNGIENNTDSLSPSDKTWEDFKNWIRPFTSGDSGSDIEKSSIEAITGKVESLLTSATIKAKERFEKLIADEINIAHSEGTPTSRLTSLYNKLNLEEPSK